MRRTARVIIAAALVLAHAEALAAAPAVSARGAHAVVVKGDGTVSAWGSNSDGQLGDGRLLLDATPARAQNLPPMSQAASSAEHVVAVDAKWRVWTWGSTTHARLGIRPQRDPARPGRVEGIDAVMAVAATDHGSYALKSDRTVWRWGGVGICGNATILRPEKIAGVESIVQISGGGDHVLMRTSGGSVVVYGSNFSGVHGDGTVDALNTCRTLAPVAVPALTSVAFVSAGLWSSHAVTTDGRLYSWGGISNPFFAPIVPRPTLVSGFPKPVRSIAGREVYYAVLDDETVWSWTPEGAAPATFTQVAGLAGIKQIAVPAFFERAVLARDGQGRLFFHSRNNFGEHGLGHASDAEPGVVQVPLPDPVSTMSVAFFGVVAIAVDGTPWTWGRDGLGLLGRGGNAVSAAPVATVGLGDIRKLALGASNTFALDGAGNVWAWDNNNNAQLQPGSQARTPSSIPTRMAGVGGVVDIAASWNGLLMLGADGNVRTAGVITNLTSVASPIAGLPPVAGIAAGWDHAFFITANGELWALGNNSSGQLGDGTTAHRLAPVRITGLPPVAQVATEFGSTFARTTTGEVWAWGRYGTATFGDPSRDSLVPQRIAGVADAVEIAAGSNHGLARRRDGTVLSWGPPSGPGLGRGGDSRVPGVVEGLDQVVSIAAANGASYAIRADGSVWGWGGMSCLASSCPLAGDGTFVNRERPVVVIRENGAGNLDTADWFLDAKPGTPKTIPPASIPKVIATATALSTDSVLNADAALSVRQADQSRAMGLYVLGLVPAEFLSQVPTAPGAHALAAKAKDGQPILVNLTPAGWTVVSGQLTALTTGVGNAFLGATGLLTNVNPASIPGARFCIGYGESASDMLRAESIRDFLSLPGAGASASGLPCLLSGVYVDGPPTSQAGNAVPLRAIVVGQSPTGTVWFREKLGDISQPLAVTARNAAISDASIAFTPAGAGEYAFSARYAGDALNLAASSEIPLRHVVNAMHARQTTTRIDAPVSSEIGTEVRLAAVVTGNRPSGTVQFKRGETNEGAPVPVIDDRAVINVVGLGLGDHTFTATYSGDGANQPATSPPHAHRVLEVSSSAVSLASAANPASLGEALALTTRVSGASPTGTVALREGANVIGVPVALADGGAVFTVPAPGPGVHVYTVDYSGDAANPRATSNPVFQQVNLTLSPSGDYDRDGIPNAIEIQESLRPDVKDNDIFGNARLFAMQQYRDFLAREGDASGVSHWSGRIAAGTETRARAIESFFSSAEFQGSIAPVARLYFAYFLRVPDHAGLEFWIGRYRAGSSLDDISKRSRRVPSSPRATAPSTTRGSWRWSTATSWDAAPSRKASPSGADSSTPAP